MTGAHIGEVLAMQTRTLDLELDRWDVTTTVNRRCTGGVIRAPRTKTGRD